MMTSASHQFSVDAISLFVALICACVVIGHLLEENRWINESITSLLIGLCTGILILLTTEGKSSHILEFDEELFFIYLLPPIIFNAGFKVKKKQFFRNFMTIMLFGAVGTFISFSIISFGTSQLFKKLDIGFLEMPDYLAIGAILSATDSVCTLQVLNQEETPLLYSLVFGESVVNDATAVVLFNAIKRFDISHVNSGIALQFVGNFFSLFITSTLLGVFIGLLCAYMIRKLFIGRNIRNFSPCTKHEDTENEVTDREVALMILMAYLSYVMAELFDLSGILTVFFCGIVMSHYSWHNVTEYSRITTKHAFATLSFVAEIFIFLYVGMDALDIEKWKFVSNSRGKSVAVSSILLGLVLVGRAAFIFPLSFISNLTRESKSEKIEFKQQVTIWWAGLMRGAVSMALAYNQFTRSGHTQQPGNAVMITSTITVVLFSTVVFGLTTKLLLRFLLPPANEMISMVSSEPSSPKSLTIPLIGSGQDSGAEAGCPNVRRPSSLRMLLNHPTNTVHYYWRKFDDTYMRPVFGGRGFVPRVPGSQTDAG